MLSLFPEISSRDPEAVCLGILKLFAASVRDWPACIAPMNRFFLVNRDKYVRTLWFRMVNIKKKM